MLYLSSFTLSDKKVKNPNIYPYNVFKNKDSFSFVFSPITVFYGNNGCGKSTILNIMANKLKLSGMEYSKTEEELIGTVDYCMRFSNECSFTLADDEDTGLPLENLPKESRFIKSEDILYEVKKIEQSNVLKDGMLYDYVKAGKSKEDAKAFLLSKEGKEQIGYILYSQEKYSNGETALMYFDNYLEPDALYLLDEPEVSLSPANQVKLAEKINEMVRFFGCQFIISTHSPFLLGTLNAKIYNLDDKSFKTFKWSELENVKYFYNFFEQHKEEFS